MKLKRLCNIVWVLLLSVAVHANDSIAVATDSVIVALDSAVVLNDTAIVLNDTILPAQDSVAQKNKARTDTIFQAAMIKLDIASPAMVAGMNKGKLQHYELAVNVRLKNRFYPTLELGYAGGRTGKDSISYKGKGGFFRVGCDVNPLRKNIESPHALLIGVRLGTAVQRWKNEVHNTGGVRADCWGEVVAGCQVEIASGKKAKTASSFPMAFYMGWMGRIRLLFTRTLTKEVKETLGPDIVDINPYLPVYIPGFGLREEVGWGLNYYLGWRF